ncbi:MAG: type II toxin-antitoxin system VapC family toxin [Acidimicrobiia bacterium]
MIVLDTTVLVYAVGADHPLAEPSRAIIDAAANGRVAATTTVEVIQEFTHVRTRRRGRADAVALARAYTDLLAPLLVVDEAMLAQGLDLYSSHEQLGAFDAVLAASAIRSAADALVSADRAFSVVAGLRFVHPAEWTGTSGAR